MSFSSCEEPLDRLYNIVEHTARYILWYYLQYYNKIIKSSILRQPSICLQCAHTVNTVFVQLILVKNLITQHPAIRSMVYFCKNDFILDMSHGFTPRNPYKLYIYCTICIGIRKTEIILYQQPQQHAFSHSTVHCCTSTVPVW